MAAICFFKYILVIEDHCILDLHQNSLYFVSDGPVDIFKYTLLSTENLHFCIPISLKYMLMGPLERGLALDQAMAWGRQATGHYMKRLYAAVQCVHEMYVFMNSFMKKLGAWWLIFNRTYKNILCRYWKYAPVIALAMELRPAITVVLYVRWCIADRDIMRLSHIRFKR